MPELPEVETVVRGLRGPLTGQKIAAAQVFSAKIRTPIPPHFPVSVKGRTIQAVTRRAKYILIALDKNLTMIIHLGMTGNISLLDRVPGNFTPARHDHLFLRFANGSGLVFSDPRRFGVLDLVASDALADWPSLRDLGPEPLDRSFTGTVLENLLAGRKIPIKLALMNQNLLVGVGNIYASEALFYAGISPLEPAAGIRGERAGLLCRMIKKVLRAAINAGGSTLRDYRRTTGELGDFQHRFAVYDREGQACPGCTCDVVRTGGIRRITQGGRSTFYCPRKQT